MNRLALTALLGATLLAGCAGHSSKLQAERTYSVEWIGDRPLLDNSHLTLTLASDGRAYGTAGCNHWFAAYTLAHHHLNFATPGSTRRLCAPAVMEQEQRFLKALETVQRWDIQPNEQLRLWPENGQPLRLWPEEG
ncbi:META domain-containing protein [Pseudomonas sp. HR96]|uniref:META domain-containing protein n=1 Tax=Pseudomonas sp. HR96 TaxID=1027966 RepID=UPI002A75EAD6|nr:META domain-containing protein [Pseudomonas sp. HR96]WPO98977.1 META domain-containing protein [Pseudomonas sp. HR96]